MKEDAHSIIAEKMKSENWNYVFPFWGEKCRRRSLFIRCISDEDGEDYEGWVFDYEKGVIQHLDLDLLLEYLNICITLKTDTERNTVFPIHNDDTRLILGRLIWLLARKEILDLK